MSARGLVSRKFLAIVSLTAVGCLGAGVLASPASSIVPSRPAVASTPTSATALAAARSQLRSGQAVQAHGVYDFCAAKKLACQASYLTTSRASNTPLVTARPIGYGADDLAKAYSLTSAPS